MESLSSLVSLGDAGVVGVCLAILFFGYLIFKLVVEQWKASTEAQKGTTEAIDRNTKSFENLSLVFEKQSVREMEFQRDVLSMLKEGKVVIDDTHSKVTDIHRKVFITDKEALNHAGQNESHTGL